jgi:hypothetical protein
MSVTNARLREILTAARARIARGWCQLAAARDADGFIVPPASSDAVSWCPSGALNAEAQDDDEWRSAAVSLLRFVDPQTFARWNDAPDRQQSDVLALFDRALAALETP